MTAGDKHQANAGDARSRLSGLDIRKGAQALKELQLSYFISSMAVDRSIHFNQGVRFLTCKMGVILPAFLGCCGNSTSLCQ